MIDELEIPAEDYDFLATLAPIPKRQRERMAAMDDDAVEIMSGKRNRKRTQRDYRAEAMADKAQRVAIYAAQVDEQRDETGQFVGSLDYLEPAPAELREAVNVERELV